MALAGMPGYYERVITGTVPENISFEVGQPNGNAFFAARAEAADLDRLTTELLRVIQETMEPEHISIWLKPIDDPHPMTADRGPIATGNPHALNR